MIDMQNNPASSLAQASVGQAVSSFQNLTGAELLKSQAFLSAVDSAFESMGRFADLILPSADQHRHHGIGQGVGQGLGANLVRGVVGAATGTQQTAQHGHSTEFGQELLMRAVVNSFEHMPKKIAEAAEESADQRKKQEAVETERRLEEARRDEFLHPNNNPKKRNVSYV